MDMNTQHSSLIHSDGQTKSPALELKQHALYVESKAVEILKTPEDSSGHCSRMRQ